MKKILIAFTAMATVSVLLTGCLKDKKFDNNEYGIEDPAGSPDGVGLTLGASGLQTRGLNVGSTPQSVTDLLILNLLAGKPASADVTATVVSDTSLVRSYNTANGTSIQILPASAFTFGKTQFTIKAGTTVDTMALNVGSTLSLDPNKIYGIGLRIATASAGYTIAKNYSTIVVQIGLKNRYDGKYRLKTQFYHPTSAPGFPLLTTDLINLETSGPNSVKMRSLVPGLQGFYHPWTAATGGSITAFGNQEPEYTVNPTTKAVTVQNSFTGATTFYTMGKGFNNAGYNSRWDSASKMIYANFGYMMTGDNFVPGASRMWIDTLIYLGPR